MMTFLKGDLPTAHLVYPEFSTASDNYPTENKYVIDGWTESLISFIILKSVKDDISFKK